MAATLWCIDCTSWFSIIANFLRVPSVPSSRSPLVTRLQVYFMLLLPTVWAWQHQSFFSLSHCPFRQSILDQFIYEDVGETSWQILLKSGENTSAVLLLSMESVISLWKSISLVRHGLVNTCSWLLITFLTLISLETVPESSVTFLGLRWG